MLELPPVFFVLNYGIDGERASFIFLFNQKDSNKSSNFLCPWRIKSGRIIIKIYVQFQGALDVRIPTIH